MFYWLLLLAEMAANQESSTGKPWPPQRNVSTVVFAVSGESGEASTRAVVVADSKRLREPFSDGEKEKQEKFAKEYFAASHS